RRSLSCSRQPPLLPSFPTRRSSDLSPPRTCTSVHGVGHAPDFETVVERHRREIQVHCYRMLGSLSDAEDLAQETFLRAWKARDRDRKSTRLTPVTVRPRMPSSA